MSNQYQLPNPIVASERAVAVVLRVIETGIAEYKKAHPEKPTPVLDELAEIAHEAHTALEALIPAAAPALGGRLLQLLLAGVLYMLDRKQEADGELSQELDVVRALADAAHSELKCLTKGECNAEPTVQ